jgi:hypothetical protein
LADVGGSNVTPGMVKEKRILDKRVLLEVPVALELQPAFLSDA